MPLASFATPLLVDSRARTHNIRKASARIDRLGLASGETFSLDRAIGPRELGDGYVMAPAIVGDELRDAPAGGICQLATTLYNAALLAGVTIVERHPHGRAVHYVPPGRDATIARYHKDLKLRNDFTSPIEIRAGVVGERVVVQILGRRREGISRKLRSRRLGASRFATYLDVEQTSGTRISYLVSEDSYR